MTVNKGPVGFSANLRAEMLSALSVTDWIGINDCRTQNPFCVASTERVRKGCGLPQPQRRRHQQDHSRTSSRRRVWGKLVFTDDITFSSSELLNRHFDVFEPQVKDFLSRLREGEGPTKSELIEKLGT